jgi:HAD superfamily hydrolase (TIGR01509 family)
MLRAILFDLDDTLLCTQTDGFMERYFSALGAFMGPSTDPALLQKQIMKACFLMTQYDHPDLSNAEAFSVEFAKLSGNPAGAFWERLWRFYREEYPRLGERLRVMPGGRAAVLEARELGLKVVIATNPLFPLCAVATRLTWAGLSDVPFDLATGLENMHYAKPQPQYYQEIAATIGVKPEECLMVGNDPVHDIAPAKTAGMHTFLVRPEGSTEPPQEADAAGSLYDLTQGLRAGTLPGMERSVGQRSE